MFMYACGKAREQAWIVLHGCCLFFGGGGGGDDVVVWRVVRQGLSLADLDLTSSLNWLAQ